MQTLASLLDMGGRVAVVTGGTRGLGRAISFGLAEAGATVVVASRKLDACEETAAAIREETGVDAVGLACHVGRWDDVGALADEVYERFGKVDVLVNNAGMSPLYDTVEGITEELYDKVFAVNSKGPFRLASLVGSRMARAGSGSIVNISSIGSVHPTADVVPYAGAKAALNAMTIGLAQALAPNVRVNCIMPGAFRTSATSGWDDELVEALGARAALGRFGAPEEIVGGVLYLASDLASYTTGAVFAIDGGVVT